MARWLGTPAPSPVAGRRRRAGPVRFSVAVGYIKRKPRTATYNI